jgi:rSAM/selenodomain-associated transferase 2
LWIILSVALLEAPRHVHCCAQLREIRSMISVVIPTLNAEDGLAACLTALVPAAVEGMVREVIVVDGGSSDRTLKIIEQSGAELVHSSPGRGEQLALGAARARGPWLLFLHADTVLEPGWEREVAALVERIDSGRRQPTAAAFRFALDDDGVRARMIEAGVAMRCALFRLPYGDQGLLIPRQLYQQAGGYSRMPLMEDVDLVRRIGRRRMTLMRSRAVTSAVRYQRDGYVRRSVRNLTCLTLYVLRVPTRFIARLYG